MKLKINVEESFQKQFDELLKENGITPEMIVESEGFDGIAIWKYILEYGPDTFKLLTAIVAFWNEIQKSHKKGENKKIEIILETDGEPKE